MHLIFRRYAPDASRVLRSTASTENGIERGSGKSLLHIIHKGRFYPRLGVSIQEYPHFSPHNLRIPNMQKFLAPSHEYTRPEAPNFFNFLPLTPFSRKEGKVRHVTVAQWYGVSHNDMMPFFVAIHFFLLFHLNSYFCKNYLFENFYFLQNYCSIFY